MRKLILKTLGAEVWFQPQITRITQIMKDTDKLLFADGTYRRFAKSA